MMVLSKFHDYYDSALAYGVDKTIVYRREAKITPIQKLLPLPGNSYSSQEFINGVEVRNYSVDFFWIGFCGKIYLGRRDRYKTGGAHNWKEQEVFEYGPDMTIFNRNYIETQTYPANGSDFLEFFLKHKTPCFLLWRNYQKYELVLNPPLKPWHFFKVFDSFAANQEIQRFLTNELAEERTPPIKQTDKEKVKSHGFDKLSFRREKQTK